MPRTSATDAVFEQLAGQIVAGTVGVGEVLPPERALAESLGVSRPVVREALQRLSAERLVAINHGEPTTIQDWQRTAGPDLLPRLLLTGSGIQLDVARHVVEARAEFGPPVAARAAERSDPEACDRLDEIVKQMSASDQADLPALQRLALSFWDEVVEASGSIVHRLLFNALSAAYTPVMDALAVVMATEVTDGRAYRSIAKAIRDGSPDRARRAVTRLVERGTDAALAAIDVLEAQQSGETR